jgi:hypothetical protein
MGIFDKLLGKGSWYNPAGFIGNAGDLKKFAGTKLGSVMSGRAILQGGPKAQDMEGARTLDVFGSPATAGGKQQTTARLGAALYGLGAGAAAYGGGLFGGGATGMNAAPSASPGGAGAMGGGGSSGWMNYARLGNAMMQQGQQGQGAQGQQLQHQYVGENPRNPYLTPLSTQAGQNPAMLYALQALEREGQGDLYRQGGLYGSPGSTYGI